MPVHLCCHLSRGHVDLEIVRLEPRKACLQREAATDTHHLARRAEERLWEQLLRFQMASQSLVPVPLRPNCLAVGIYDKKKKNPYSFSINCLIITTLAWESFCYLQPSTLYREEKRAFGRAAIQGIILHGTKWYSLEGAPVYFFFINGLESSVK